MIEIILFVISIVGLYYIPTWYGIWLLILIIATISTLVKLGDP